MEDRHDVGRSWSPFERQREDWILKDGRGEVFADTLLCQYEQMQVDVPIRSAA